MSNNDLLLRALRMNAAFSSISALTLLAAGPWIAAQLGLGDAVPVYITGALLAGFALQLWNIVRTRAFRGWQIRSIIGGDIAWVVGTAVLVALYYSQLTITGLLLVDGPTDSRGVYTPMTRGRDANHAFVVTGTDDNLDGTLGERGKG